MVMDDPVVTAEERRERGRALRKAVPRSSHAEWTPTEVHRDPVELITRQNEARLPRLIPIRHGRMAVSPFTFYRGAAALMAFDLSHTPVTGLTAQICGDAHIANFGSFGSVERRQVFDVNDFDETLPGPWEWDVKRLAASVVLAARDNGYGDDDARAVTQGAVFSYRRAMASLAERGKLDVWYAALSLDEIKEQLSKKKARSRLTKFAAKARSKDSLRAMQKLTERVDGRLQISSVPPLLVTLRDLSSTEGELYTLAEESLARYRLTLDDDRRHLLDEYRLEDVALKVVGVGSVGTRCLVALLVGRDEGDPLFLQIKQATRSVLEDYLPPSRYDNHGRRVVEGQRLMQATTDIFLGWSEEDGDHHYYWRQFHDMKGSFDLAGVSLGTVRRFASLCGWTLARAHARSGDPSAIAGYVGRGDVLDRAMAEFAIRYAEQNLVDYAAFTEAIADGRVAAEED
jgi:uncharacterized protein (DUF2252 family)